MYIENGNAEAYLSVKRNSKWGVPEKILSKFATAHYLQVTRKGNFYISSKATNTVGLGDWCKLEFTDTDTIATGMGMPLNTAWDNLDFFVSPDESFMIVTTPFGLAISYPKSDGTWTNPRNLGPEINFGLGMWGPYVTPDQKYLFYTTGTRQDYSDVNVHWVRFDHLIDSRKRGKSVKFPIPKDSKEDIIFFKELIEAGKYKAVIDRIYSLEKIVEATKYVETGQKTGNVVLTVEHHDQF